MDFLKAVKAMKEGKKVRRPSWDKSNFMCEKDGFFYWNDGGASSRVVMALENCEATDWEILEEEKDYIYVCPHCKTELSKDIMGNKCPGCQKWTYTDQCRIKKYVEVPTITENASERKYCPYCNTGKLHRHIVTVDKGIVNYIKSLGEFKDIPLVIEETKTLGEIDKLIKAMFEDGDNYVVNYAKALKDILEKTTKKKSLSDKLDELKKFSPNSYQQKKLKEELERRNPISVIYEKEREQAMRCEEFFKESIEEFLRRFSEKVTEIPPPYDLAKEIFGKNYVKPS